MNPQFLKSKAALKGALVAGALVALGVLALPCWLATSHSKVKSITDGVPAPVLRPVFLPLNSLAPQKASAPAVRADASTSKTALSTGHPAAKTVPYIARLEHSLRVRWEKDHPQFAHKSGKRGSYEEVAHLVSRSDWDALKPIHRDMICGQVEQARRGIVGVMPCFAPGTDVKVMQAFEGINNSLQFFRTAANWSSTATNSSHIIGAPLTLRWSIVADGTLISKGTGITGPMTPETAGPSDLKARLNAIYGNETTWRALFRDIFARWSAVSGLTYVEEMNDDGKAIDGSTSFPGVIGTRGDIRIGGHNIDGVNNILAYNYFPQVGDMVIDTGDTSSGGFFLDTSKNSLGFRNVLTHEHGHGLGFAHVCPINQTKLMEPFVSYNFDGPQIDDIQNAQRGYGDPFEDNDSQPTATDLGALDNGTISKNMVSLDSSSDTDFYGFSLSTSKMLTATLRPIGGSYLEGAQNSDGSCTAGTTFNATAQRDLQLAVFDNTGKPIAQINATGVGSNEILPSTLLTKSNGPFAVRVSGDAQNLLQLYSIDLTLSNAPGTSAFSTSGSITVSDIEGNGNSNGRPDPGESSLRLTIPLLDTGDTAASNVKARLTSLTSGVTVSQPVFSYPNIASNSTASNITFPTFAIAPNFSCGTLIQFRLNVQSDQGNSVLNVNLTTGVLSQQSYAYTGAALPIADAVANNSPGATTVATINVSGSSTISDLDLALDSITHTYVGDLVITLTSPGGTTVTVVNRAGGVNNGGDNFSGTVLDDEATNPIQSVVAAGAPYTGSFIPANALSAFDGQNANGTWTLRVQDYGITDTGTLRNFSLKISTIQCGVPAPIAAPTSGVLISEYRLSGPGGNADEFIELMNTANTPLDISNWSIGAGSLSIPIPAGTTPIAARGHLLLTGTGYSLADLGGVGVAAGNVSISSDIPDGTSILLKNAAGNTVDAVSSANLPTPLATTDNYSYVRRLDSGVLQDTDSDSSDFNLVDVESKVGPNNTTGVSSGMRRIGAPDPQNLGSPTALNALISFTPASPGVVRTGSGDTGNLSLRNVVTNRSTRTITALRFNVLGLTSGTTAVQGSAPADIRLISSTSSNGMLLPLVLQGPSQPNGGGLNSTVSLANLPGGGLAPNQSITVEMYFEIKQKGTYRFLLNFEPMATP